MKKILVVDLILFLGLTIAPSINAFVFTGESQSEASSEDSTYGCVFQGHGDDGDDKFWPQWRDSASGAFGKWVDTLSVQARPPVDRISYNIKVLNVSYFYVIAHSDGQSDRFRTSAPGVHYTADQLKEDMSDRPPIKLAILCCCEAMTDTGPDTLSYEFRKGQMEDTAVIGYTNLKEFKEKNGDFKRALDWQDCLFGYINRGNTVKRAFDKACKMFEGENPSIADYVEFVGDENLKVKANINAADMSEENDNNDGTTDSNDNSNLLGDSLLFSTFDPNTPTTNGGNTVSNNAFLNIPSKMPSTFQSVIVSIINQVQSRKTISQDSPAVSLTLEEDTMPSDLYIVSGTIETEEEIESTVITDDLSDSSTVPEQTPEDPAPIPEDPVKPVDPIYPINPIDPVDPITPIDPVDPTRQSVISRLVDGFRGSTPEPGNQQSVLPSLFTRMLQSIFERSPSNTQTSTPTTTLFPIIGKLLSRLR